MEKNEKNLLGMIGICRSAGATIIGTPQICDELRRRGEGYPHIIVLEASDTSENTHKKISDKCNYYQVRQVRLSCDGATLASALGKTSALAAVAVSDPSFCTLIESALNT